jgi:hypothetical protein
MKKGDTVYYICVTYIPDLGSVNLREDACSYLGKTKLKLKGFHFFPFKKNRYWWQNLSFGADYYAFESKEDFERFKTGMQKNKGFINMIKAIIKD